MAWNRQVLDAGAPLWQLPFWRAFLQRPQLHVRYFVERDDGQLRSWVCVMEWGAPGYRVALVQDGPVDAVHPDRPVSDASVQALCAMLRSRGYVFVRFSHAARKLSSVSSLPAAVTGDLFPFFCRDVSELHVRLTDEETTLGGFQKHARYLIRRAGRRGYQVRSGNTEDLVDPVHQVILKTAARKGFRVPSRATLVALLREASAVEGVRLYLAQRADGEPVSAIVVGVDRSTWHYLFGGVDTERTGGVSPTTLLHWTAMCDAIRAGATVYNLGSASPPSIAQFKQSFCPVQVPPPVAVTVPLRPVATAAWRWGALPVLQRLWPSAQQARNRLWQRQHTGEPVTAGSA
jgi:hypothetical protein